MGVLRMDVDHLGKIFGRGLGDRATFARINDLSERFNLYFKYYLPHTLEKNNTSCMGIPRDKLLINLVYAGGDDLFLVGTWDSAIDAACIINEDFKRFTGFNPNFTISGGISIVHEKTAFYRMAREAGKEEGLAKDSGRNRLSIFSIPLKWEEINGTSGVTLNHLMHLLVSLGGEFKNNKLIPKAYSRSFIQNLLFLIQSYLSTSTKNNRPLIYPQIHYVFSRTMNVNQQFRSSFYLPLLSVMLKEGVLDRQVLLALQITDYLSRGGQ